MSQTYKTVTDVLLPPTLDATAGKLRKSCDDPWSPTSDLGRIMLICCAPRKIKLFVLMTFKSLNRYLTGLCICGVSECGRCPAVDGSLSGQNICLECTESLGKM